MRKKDEARDTLVHLPAPESVGWELTLRCNMRCKHCCSAAGNARADELDTRQALKLCRQFIDMRVGRVVFTGGEPLLRKDWRQLGETILAGGVGLGLLTNGWAFDQPVLRELLGFRGTSFHVLVSLDGTARVHDGIRGFEGSFERAYRGTQYLIGSGIPCGVITTVHDANLGSLPRLREQVLEELRPYVWQIQITTPFGRARKHAECSVSPETYKKLARFIVETRKMAQGSPIEIATGDCIGYRSRDEEKLRDGPWQGCQAGLMIIGIQSNGNVKGCLSIIDDRFVEGNALTEGLANIWHRPGAFAYTRRFQPAHLKGACKSCAVGPVCRGGCSASSISVYGVAFHAPYCLKVWEDEAAAARRRKPARARATATTARRKTARAKPKPKARTAARKR